MSWEVWVMMSTVSLGKRGTPFWRMFLFTLKTNKSIITIGSIIALLAMPIFTIVSIFSSNGEVGAAVVCGLGIEAVIAILMVAILTITNFGFLHNKSSSDMYYSLPITRKDLYLSRLFATIIGASIPSVLSLLVSIAFLSGINDNISFTITVFKLLEYVILCVVMVAAISIFTSMFMLFTGQTFDALVSFFGINIGLPVLALIISGYLSSKLYGATSDIFGLVEVLNFTPLGKAADFMINYIYKLTVYNSSERVVDIGVIVWLIIAVLALILCISFSKKRRSEKAGESYAHPLLPIILQVIISAIVAFGMGELFSLLTSFSIIYFIFAIIGSLLASVVLGAVINRGFKRIKKDLIIGGCSAVLVVAFGLSILGGFFGFETRVPNLNSVKKVVFRVDAGFDELSGSVYTEAKEIGAVIDFHSAIIDKTMPKDTNIITGKPNNYPFVVGSTVGDGEVDLEKYNQYCSFRVDYYLKSGKIVSRSYGGYFGYHCKKELRAMLDTENYMNMFEIEKHIEGLHSTTIYYYNNDASGDIAGPQISFEKAIKLANSYREDIIDGVEERGVDFELSVSGINTIDNTPNSDGSHSVFDDEYGNLYLRLNPSFEKTIKLMKEYGFKIDLK